VVGVSVWMGVIVLSGYQVICSDSRSVGLFVCSISRKEAMNAFCRQFRFAFV